MSAPSARRRLLGRAGGAALAGTLPAAASVATTVAAAAADAPAAFAFALIGDVPYFASDIARTREVLASIDAGCDFVVHVGDIKSASDSCADEAFAERLALLSSSRRPLVFVPGDNDWSDCLRPSAGGYRPFERLDFLRRRLFATPASLGDSSLRMESQAGSGNPEHLRWVHRQVMFVTVNRPGGVDPAQFSREEATRYRRLLADGETWLREAFARAKGEGLRAIVVASHANPFFDNDRPGARVRPERDPHRGYRATLAELSDGFDGAVLFLHGDTHRFQVNQPLYRAAGDKLGNFTRVESFGTPFSSSWVRIAVSPRAEQPFLVSVRHLDPSRPS